MASFARQASGNSSQFTYMPVSPMEPTDIQAKLPGYPADRIIQAGNRPKWKPFVLKTPFLLLFFLTTVALIAVIEALHQKSDRDRGLFFANRLDDFTAWETFSYRYLMTVISVVYGMTWGLVDLDVKRLEPYFQLASAKGATAANSIMLCYPLEFLAVVPITALARRHWSVFCAGFALLLISWVITPMQAALLTTETVPVNVSTQFVASQTLAPFDSQAAGLEVSSKYLFTAFRVTWLDEQPPPFTTTEYAATPFRPLSGGPGRGTNETWTAMTRTYKTDLDCTLGTSAAPGEPFNITNNAGCYVPISPIPPSNKTRNIQYLGFGNWDGLAGWYLPEKSCKGGPNIFMAIWAETSQGRREGAMLPADTDITAVFCTPNYHYTDEEITVDAETLLIKSVTKLGDPVPFTQEDGIIDLNRFEKDLSSGRVDESHQQLPMRFISPAPPTGASRYEEWGLVRPTSQVSYAIGMSPGLGFEDFKDPRTLSEAFVKVHRLLFATYVSSLLRDIPGGGIDGDTVLGNRSMDQLAVVVSGVFARLLEGFLAVVAVCFAVLGVITYRRNSNLFGDPDSLAAKMAFVADSKALLEDFDGLDESPDLKEEFGDRTYRLDSWDSNGYYRIDFEGRLKHEASRKSSGAGKQYSGVAVRPFLLSTTMGILLVLFLAGLLGFLIPLYKSAQKYNGLPILSNRQFVVGVIFSFIPTVIATGIEPVWVLLARYFCVYQPYTELAKGRAPASKSLALKYSNIPPVLTFFRALRANHIIIFLLSATALLANLLTVSLSGLFSNEMQPFDIPTTFIHPLADKISTTLAPRENTVDYDDEFRTFAIDPQEPWIIAMANITQASPLPPWVTPEYYFLPFEWKNSTNTTTVHKATTSGFGVDLDCQPLEDESFQAVVYLSGAPAENGGSRFGINITLPIDDGRTVRCASPGIDAVGVDAIPSEFTGLGSPGQKVTLEYLFRLAPLGPDADRAMNETCASALVVGWGQALAVAESDGSPFIDLGSYKNVTLVCRQRLKAAMFEVTVDESQRVQYFKKLDGSDQEPTGLFQHTTMRDFTAQVATIVKLSASQRPRYGNEMYWHNDSIPRKAPHYLVDNLLGSSFCDPSQPLAAFEALSDGYNQVFQRLFAITLGQNSHRIFAKNPAGVDTLVDGFSVTPVQRVTMDPTMFYTSATIIALNIAVGILAYLFRPRNFLPRLPATLASEIAYFYSSQALKDVSGTVSMSSVSREKHLDRLGHEYGFGDFKDQDGKKHRGVERSSILELA